MPVPPPAPSCSSPPSGSGSGCRRSSTTRLPRPRRCPRCPRRLDDRFVALQAITAEQAGLTSAEQTAQFKTFVASTIASEKQANKSLAKEYGAARARRLHRPPRAGEHPAEHAGAGSPSPSCPALPAC
ncbi:hypothetical protein G5V59_14205 [Nocardioides sp. W3-2-3]|uniref:hypothetical protein n=1 Tax=Nocardioides convexus TaxID=2712224 RepID=UPI0024182067|nr:hypothetical protein [Nocardioides convexus]NHA00751.1 hypothetical protein [Nocardioides convexus]